MDSKAEGGDQNESESGTQSGKYKSALWLWINAFMGYNYRRTPSIWKAYNCIIIYKLVLQTDPNRITHPRNMLFQMRAINGSILCTHELLRSEFTSRMTDVRLGNDIWEKEHLGLWDHTIVSYVFDGIYYQLRINVGYFSKWYQHGLQASSTTVLYGTHYNMKFDAIWTSVDRERYNRVRRRLRREF